MTVLPDPNGPGTQAVPPRAIGKNVSTTRCPVVRGTSGGRRLTTGRGLRTGQRWSSCMVCSAPFASVITAMVSSTVNSPPLMTLTVPSIPCGTIILWSTSTVSLTEPIKSPGATLSPATTHGSNFHFLVRLTAGTLMPRRMYGLFALFSMLSSGRWIPS